MDRLKLGVASELDNTFGTVLIHVFCAAASVFVLLVWVTRFLNNRRKAAKWAKIAKGILLEVRSKRHECLEKENDVVKGKKTKDTENEVKMKEEEDSKICMMSIKELQSSMRTGEFTCERCLMAFIRRTRRLGLNECNAVTEEMYDSAVSKARELDKSGILKKRPKADQPLLGIPMSIKESCFQEGCLSTEGLIRFALPDTRETKDGLLVSLFRSSGAIPFVRTNVPQLLFMVETENYLWGRTTNPWNPLRTPGGSSGGESALIALRASPLGCGTDIGGSVRIPSHFSGVVGFKPTPNRVTRKGLSHRRYTRRPGIKPVTPVAGPLANSVADCELFMRAVMGPKMWEEDPHVCPVPWNGTLAQRGPGRRLKIGFFVSDGWFDPCSAVSRAVHEAVDALENTGHEIIPFTPPHTGWDVFRIYSAAMNRNEMMGMIVKKLHGEPLLDQYQRLKLVSGIPNCLRPMLAFVLRQLGQYRIAHTVTSIQKGNTTINADNSCQSDISQLQTEMHNEMKDSNVDVILFPTVPLPAFKHGGARTLFSTLTYCFLVNLLHWPSGTVPVTVVAENEQEYLHPHDLPKNQRSCLIGKAAHKHMQKAAGLPCGVQIMAGPYKDEICLFAMAELEQELQKSKPLHYMVPPLLTKDMKNYK